MRSMRQLLRQPGKTVLGILLVALAVGILSVCLGQYTAAAVTRAGLEDRYDTVALPADSYFWEEGSDGSTQYNTHLSALPPEPQTWLDGVLENRKDLVKTQSKTGLYSAYIPELSIDNYSRHPLGDQMIAGSGTNAPYRFALLEVTLTQVCGGVLESGRSFSVGGSTEKQTVLSRVTTLCLGRVERVIGLEEGYLSPEGASIVLAVTAADQAALDALRLQAGEQYLVFGKDYSVTENQFLGMIGRAPALYQELFGENIYSDEEGGNGRLLMEKVACGLTVCDESSLPEVLPVFDEAGNMAGFEASQEVRRDYYWDGEEIHERETPAQAYIRDYSMPTMARLEGSAEEFLSERADWRQALEALEISNHGFPVLAVDKLGYQAAFAREQARIVEGRDFTEAELRDGKKVCVIAQSLAAANGLGVGDIIQMRPYGYDPNLNDNLTTAAMLSAFPDAAVYSRAMGFDGEAEEYTIVGLYRQQDAWENQTDAYGFTPNTVFVPKASADGTLLFGNQGLFYTLVLQNGKAGELAALTKQAGYPGLFVCYDQGYSRILSGLDSYEGISQRALAVGFAAYGVLLILYLLLFPARQGRDMLLMNALGTPRGMKIRHILLCALGLLIPGTALGAAAGALAFDAVAEELMASVRVEIPLEANMAALVPALAAAQLLLAVALVMILAVFLSRPRGLGGRK